MNENKIISFENRYFGTLRVIEQYGEPWFIAVDVCNALEIRTDSIRGILDEDEVSEINPNTIGVAGGRNPLIISESGLYSLVMKSRKPDSKQFRRWITHEILPSIRKHGLYATPQAAESFLKDPDILINALQALKAERAKRVAVEEQRKIEAPKILFADSVAGSQTSILIGTLATIIAQNGVDTGEIRLFDWMRKNGYLIKSGSGRNLPTQYAIDIGLFEIRETTYNTPDGRTLISPTTYVTGKGQIYFINKFLKEAKRNGYTADDHDN